MRERIEGGAIGIIVACALMVITVGCARQTSIPESQSGQPTVSQPEGVTGGGEARLRTNEVRTRHLMPGSVTAGKLAVKAVTVTVAATAASGSSAADPDLVSGFLLGCTPAGNQDQLLDNAVLNGDGSITLTLGAAATGINTFRCTAMKPDAKGVS